MPQRREKERKDMRTQAPLKEITTDKNPGPRAKKAGPARNPATSTQITVSEIPTPIGPMLAGATDKGLYLLEFVDKDSPEAQLAAIEKIFRARITQGNSPHLEAAFKQLEEYFSGRRKVFDLSLDMRGTPFQQDAWRALLAIPYGCTCSYQEQARSMGRPSAVRAVANANGANPVSIIVPCHRVIGSNGTLTGYGGGLWRKEFLLDLEKRHSV